MDKKINQPSLFPEQEPTGFPIQDIDEYTRHVAEAAPKNPYIEQENRIRRYAGLETEPADLMHHHEANDTLPSPQADSLSEARAAIEKAKKQYGTKPLYGPETGFIERRRNLYKKDIE